MMDLKAKQFGPFFASNLEDRITGLSKRIDTLEAELIKQQNINDAFRRFFNKKPVGLNDIRDALK